MCAIALNQYNVIPYRYPAVCQQISCDKRHGGTVTKELLFDVKMEMPDVTLFDETDLVRTSKDIFSQKPGKVYLYH